MVLGLSLIGLLFYYAVWLLIDENFIEMWQWGWPWTSWMVMVDYIGCCLFTTVVTLYYWRRRERTERERDKFRLQALENQLSPHFVFNNFSILADLIEVNPKQASAYLMNLSKVYRYTLSHLDHNTVKLKEELDFLHRYLSLLEQRFGEGIQVWIADSVKTAEGFLPPAALQMLIGCRISVSNKKQPIIESESTNVGLHNITERYRLLTHQKVEISESKDEYCVTIPLIK